MEGLRSALYTLFIASIPILVYLMSHIAYTLSQIASCCKTRNEHNKFFVGSTVNVGYEDSDNDNTEVCDQDKQEEEKDDEEGEEEEDILG